MKRPLPRRPVRTALAAVWLAVAPAHQAAAPRQATPARQAAPVQAGGATAPGPAQASPVQSSIEIEHQAPACVAAGQYARLDACFRPASQLARARLYFRA